MLCVVQSSSSCAVRLVARTTRDVKISDLASIVLSKASRVSM
jgi:hypothetical protein